MTALRIKGVSAAAGTALEAHVRGLYDDPHRRVIFVGELQHLSRTEPGPSSDAAPKVEVRISQLEVPSGQNQELIRQVMTSLYLMRTGRGTFSEVNGELNLSTESQRIRDSIGVMFATEATEARSVLHEVVANLEKILIMPDQVKRGRRIRKLIDGVNGFLGTGDRDALGALAQDELDLSPGVSVDVEVDDAGSGGGEPVRAGDIAAEVLGAIGAPVDPGFTGGDGFAVVAEYKPPADDVKADPPPAETPPTKPRRARKTTAPAAG
jgi:hypothetical protein